MDVEMRRLLPALLTALLIPAPAAALPLLLEVLYDGPGADADDVIHQLVLLHDGVVRPRQPVCTGPA